MSFHTIESRVLRGRSEGSDATRLRFHGSPVSAIKPPHFAELGSKDPEMLDVWSGLLDEFLDRRAAHRFQHYAVSHAGYRWKPKLALVLPEKFSVERLAHRRDLSVALEVLASAMDHYNIDVVSDSPDAARLFQEVVPFSHKAISACAGALVLLSRSLNDEVGAIRPSRYVAADPCAYRINQKRIVFAASGVELSFAPAEDGEIAREVRGSISVLLDEDDELPSFLDALRRLRGRGLPLRLTLSSRADEDFARRVQAAFDEDLRVEVHDSEPCGFGGRTEFQISNDPISLLTQRKSTLSRFLFRRSEFWRVGQETLCRSDLYLLRGEESNAHGLLRAWLGLRADRGVSTRDTAPRRGDRAAGQHHRPHLRPHGRDHPTGPLDLRAGLPLDRGGLHLQWQSTRDERGNPGRRELLDEAAIPRPHHRVGPSLRLGDDPPRSGHPGQQRRPDLRARLR